MCVGLETIGLIASIGSAVTGAIGAIQQSNAASAQGEYQAQIDRNNAVIADRAAADARKRGAAQEENQRTKTALLEGRQRAAMAAGGLDLSFGSPLDTVADTAKVGELDAQTVRGNAEREALEHLARKSNFEASANLSQMRADSAAAAGPISAFGSILGGIGTVSEKWYKIKRA